LHYLQKHEGGLEQTAEPFAELVSPPLQNGPCPGLQLMVHFSQGGGPSAVQVEAWFKSHDGEAAGVATVDLVDLPACADTGKNMTANNMIIVAIIPFFQNSRVPMDCIATFK
jgi:hypothetical protein